MTNVEFWADYERRQFQTQRRDGLPHGERHKNLLLYSLPWGVSSFHYEVLDTGSSPRIVAHTTSLEAADAALRLLKINVP